MIRTLQPFTPGHPTYLTRTGVLSGLYIHQCFGTLPFICFTTHPNLPCTPECIYYLLTPSFANYFLTRIKDPRVLSDRTDPIVAQRLRAAASLVSANFSQDSLADSPPYESPDVSALKDCTFPDWSVVMPHNAISSPERLVAKAELEALPTLKPGELDEIIRIRKLSRQRRRSS